VPYFACGISITLQPIPTLIQGKPMTGLPGGHLREFRRNFLGMTSRWVIVCSGGSLDLDLQVTDDGVPGGGGITRSYDRIFWRWLWWGLKWVFGSSLDLDIQEADDRGTRGHLLEFWSNYLGYFEKSYSVSRVVVRTWIYRSPMAGVRGESSPGTLIEFSGDHFGKC